MKNENCYKWWWDQPLNFRKDLMYKWLDTSLSRDELIIKFYNSYMLEQKIKLI